MARRAIIFGFTLPFVVAAVGGVVAAFVEITDPLMWTLILVGLAGSIPVVMGGVYRLWPVQWREMSRALLTLGLSSALIMVEVLVAVRLFVAVYFLCGGYIPA